MSILITTPHTEVPQAVVEYAMSHNSQGDTIVVLRKEHQGQYIFAATGEDSDFVQLHTAGFVIIAVYAPNAEPLYDNFHAVLGENSLL